MEEKTIVVGKPSLNQVKKYFYISTAVFALGIVLYLLNFGECRVSPGYIWTDYYTPFDVMTFFDVGFGGAIVGVLLDIGVIFGILFGIMWLLFTKVSITITDKRVYGKALFGKRVDLPLDSVSGVATLPLKGIAVATSSSSIWFFALENFEEIHNEISKLLIERQKKTTASVFNQTQQTSTADELKKLKELLDSGILTQEEFDAKKKQILGI